MPLNKYIQIMCIAGLLFLFFSTLVLIAATIGSDTSPTRFNTQQTLNNGDRVAGFAALAGGLALGNANTRGTFDTFFSVEGPIDLNAGTLILAQDFIGHNAAYIDTIGNITGQGHVVELNCSSAYLPVQTPLFPDSCSAFLLTQATTIANSSILTLDWSASDTFLAVGMSSSGGAANTVEIWSWNNNTSALTFFYGLNINSKSVNCVRWHPTLGLLAVATASNSAGAELYIYSVNWSTGVLTQLSTADIGSNSAQALSWHPSGNYLAVGTDAKNQQILLYPVSGAGVLGVPVAFNTNNVSVDPNGSMDWDATGNYLVVGLQQSVANPQLRIFRLGISPLSLTQVVALSTATAVLSADWHPTYTSLVAIGVSGNTSVTSYLYNVDVNLGTATQIGQIANLNKSTQELNWSPHGTCLALGTITPNTNPFRVFSFTATNNSFTQTFAGGISNGAGVRWSRGSGVIAEGGGDNIIYIYGTTSVTFDPNGPGLGGQCFNWSNVCLVLNSDTVLNENCILFSGNSMIDGRGHTLTLTPNARLFLDGGATLFMKDVTIAGVHNNIIGAYDSRSTFSLSHVTWLLDGNYTMTMGKYDIIDDFMISGSGYTFSYQSQGASTIYDTGGNLILNNGVILSYEPVTDNKNLINFVGQNALLTLHGATLHSTTTGLQLTKGTVVIDEASYLIADGSKASQAISFGDGTNSNNNVNLQVTPAASLSVLGGAVIYNNAY